MPWHGHLAGLILPGAIGVGGGLAFASASGTVEAFLIAMAMLIWAAGSRRKAERNTMLGVLMFGNIRNLLTLDAMGGPAFRTGNDREVIRELDAEYERGETSDGVANRWAITRATWIGIEAVIGFVYVVATT